jgi:uncharacterized RDD family membrane protein YckC
LARLRQRWLGAVIDQLLFLASAVPTALAYLALHWGMLPTLAVSAMTILPVAIWQYYLIAKTGQSLGKRAMRTRIVLQDGSPPGFVRGVVLRAWLFYGAAAIPGLGNVAGLVDSLLIFRADRRCAHDHIAGTRVIQT